MRPLLLCAAAVVLLAPLAHAQPVSTADLDAMFGAEPQVEVNLRGSLLRLAAEAARESEPEAATMLDGLRAVTVRIYPAAAAGEADAVQAFSDVASRFESDGWFTLVRVRAQPDDAEDGDVWVFVREFGDTFEGMAVMAIDKDEETAVFVHIDGTINPAQVGELSRRFARVDLDDDDASDEDPSDDEADDGQ